MKAFETLAEAELVALTEDDIQRYIDYACAENGVALLPATLPEPPIFSVPDPDVDVFKVSCGYYGSSFEFTSQDDAQRVLAVLQTTKPVTTNYVSGAPAEKVEPITGAWTLTVQRCYSPALAATIAPAAADAARAKTIYDKAKKDYDTAVRERGAYASAIREAVEAALDMHREREARRRDFERYIELADGDREIAARFLKAAHADAPKLLPELYAAEDVVCAPMPERIAEPEPEEITF